MTEVEIEPLFASAQSALLFAFNFSSEQYAPSIMGRLATGGPIGSGKGLAGLDGAGQAGLILAEVRSLGGKAERFLAARFAPHALPCSCRSPCCAGQKLGRTWSEAIGWIAEQAIYQLSGRSPNYRLRYGLVQRYFGEHTNMTELAKASRVNRDTASEHNSALLPWLKHEDGAAIHAAVDALKTAGFVA